VVKEALEATSGRPAYLEFDESTLSATYVRYPHREEMPQEIRENLIVEFYSR
jgi:small subunit ribosomal protein S4